MSGDTPPVGGDVGMNAYHTWIYEHVLNTRWFLFSIVWTVFILNVTAPVWVWFLFSGRLERKKSKK